MGLFRSARAKMADNNAEQMGLAKGTHQENCERCRHVAKVKSATTLACSIHNIAVSPNRVCGHFTR